MSKLNANKSTPKTKMILRSTGSMSTPINPDRQCQEVLKNLLSGVNEEGELLIDTIRKVVKEELLNHEIKIKELIDKNLKHTNERLDQLSSGINDLKESLEFTEQDIDNKSFSNMHFFPFRYFVCRKWKTVPIQKNYW